MMNMGFGGKERNRSSGLFFFFFNSGKNTTLDYPLKCLVHSVESLTPEQLGEQGCPADPWSLSCIKRTHGQQHLIPQSHHSTHDS